jgi:drug/metabolite transporter (DMT)-like permease
MPRLDDQHARALIGIAHLTLAALSWGLAGPAFKLVDVDFLIRLVWRGQCSLVFIAPLFAATCVARADTRTPWSRETVKGIAAVGTSMFAMFVGWNYGVSNTAFSHASVFSQTHPVFLLCIASANVAWKRRRGAVVDEEVEVKENDRYPGVVEWMCVVWTVCGVVVTATSPKSSSMKTQPTALGDALSLGCGLASAFYALSMNKWFGANGIGIQNAPGIFVQATGAFVMTAYGILTLAMVPGTVWMSSSSPYDDGVFDWPKSDYLWPGIIGMGTLAIIGHVFITEALKRLPLLVVSLSLTLTPVLQTTFAYFLIGDDAPSAQTIIGGAIIISGIGLTMVFEERRRQRDSVVVDN